MQTACLARALAPQEITRQTALRTAAVTRRVQADSLPLESTQVGIRNEAS